MIVYMSNKAKFYCEFCNTEVKANAKSCSNCGKIFVSVKCPKCGKIGPQQIFTSGCPICGYASSSGEKNKSSINFKFPEKKSYSNDSLPLWTFFVIFAVLAVIMFFVLRIFLK